LNCCVTETNETPLRPAQQSQHRGLFGLGTCIGVDNRFCRFRMRSGRLVGVHCRKRPPARSLAPTRPFTRPVRVDQRAPRLALAPACAVALHLDKTHLDDDARRFPRERLPANEIRIGRPLAGGLRVKGDQPVETVEEIQLVHYILWSNYSSYDFHALVHHRPLTMSPFSVVRFQRLDCTAFVRPDGQAFVRPFAGCMRRPLNFQINEEPRPYRHCRACRPRIAFYAPAARRAMGRQIGAPA
jgi:hypothetical protein